MQNYLSTLSSRPKDNSRFKILTKLISFSLLALIFNFSLLTFNLGRASAEVMSNTDYILKTGSFDMIAGESSDSDYKLRYPAEQTITQQTDQSDQTVSDSEEDELFFSFSISQNLIDFGQLDATNPVTRTNILTVNNPSAPGYFVTAYEDQPLFYPVSNASIPDTTCDNGMCSESIASSWTNTLTYGFGYRCDPVQSESLCETSFADQTYFKQFADFSKNEAAQVVFSGLQGSGQQAQITYKINIAPGQKAGEFSNNITFIATPSF